MGLRKSVRRSECTQIAPGYCELTQGGTKHYGENIVSCDLDNKLHKRSSTIQTAILSEIIE
jgi:hypothetical protein